MDWKPIPICILRRMDLQETPGNFPLSSSALLKLLLYFSITISITQEAFSCYYSPIDIGEVFTFIYL